MDNYERIVRDNLDKLYQNLPETLDRLLPGKRENNQFCFKAFGQSSLIGPDGIFVDDRPETGVVGILITLYALHANEDPCMPTPFKAFREFPNSLPYVGAFASHTESILIPHIDAIEDNFDPIFKTLNGEISRDYEGGDFSLIVRPFPKIKLRYIFYRADEEFPASATCLFSNNAMSFLPIDAMADTGEYTSKKIIELVS
ncbi:MAG: DUF3786 domain-containing protein [Desulfobacteraceae bacterium]|jgi:hypothetical protein|nr:DUF3786 domain-containing protein [Desulfobacteraceae bacterium]